MATQEATVRDGLYSTTDMYFAGYLKVACVPFSDTVRENGKVVFLFEASDHTVMRDLKKQYFSGTATVSALDYAQAIKWAKQLTHM